MKEKEKKSREETNQKRKIARTQAQDYPMGPWKPP